MTRRIYLNFLLCFLIGLFGQPLLGRAQNQDSLQIVHAKWKTKKIQKGVVWYQGHFQNLFQSVQEINWVEVDLRKKSQVFIAGDAKTLKTTATFAAENTALVAINGGFFDIKNGGAVDLIKINQQVINAGSDLSERPNAVFSIDGKNVLIQAASAENTTQSTLGNLMVSGPLLIADHHIQPLSKNPFNNNRHPRTAMAISNKNKLILMVVDGRSNQANGMSLPELAKLLQWIGAKDAMNLDGGGSSTMFIRDATPNHIVNYPSDNKKFDHEGERPVANIIYIK